jgi:MFS family permease
MFVIGLTGAIGNVEIDRYLIEHSPGELLGRVTSVGSLLDFCAFAVGPVVGGLLVQETTPANAILLLAALVLVFAVCSVSMPSAQKTSAKMELPPPRPAGMPSTQQASEPVQLQPQLADA